MVVINEQYVELTREPALPPVCDLPSGYRIQPARAIARRARQGGGRGSSTQAWTASTASTLQGRGRRPTAHLNDWLETVANARRAHGTDGGSIQERISRAPGA